MVLQALSHAGYIYDRGDAKLAQMVGRADTRQHQQGWAVDRPTTQHDLTRCTQPALPAPTIT
jgi:hypothetical protein